MSGTMFNIFGDALNNPIHKPMFKINDPAKENSLVGKGALSQTPARKVFASCTPQASKVKKTFLENRGAVSVGKQTNFDSKTNMLKKISKNTLQIYEDNVQTGAKPRVTEEQLIGMEYTRKPYVEDDGYLSDSDMVVTEENIDNMIFDIPEPEVIHLTHDMMNTSRDSEDFKDILCESEMHYLSLDHLDLPPI